MTYFIGLTSLVVLGLAGWLLRPWFAAHVASGVLPSVSQTVTESTMQPDERKITPSENTYIVPADQPRLLKFPSLGQEFYIQKVGIDREGRVVVPSNIDLAGWLKDSVVPGEPGLSIIDGHVSGRYRAGVFKQLNRLKVGDQIVVEMGDATKRTFTVTGSKTVPEAQASTALFANRETVDRHLNLITCASYNAATKSYPDRLIVTALAE